MHYAVYENTVSVSTVIFVKYTFKESIKKDDANPVWQNTLLYNLLSMKYYSKFLLASE